MCYTNLIVNYSTLVLYKFNCLYYNAIEMFVHDSFFSYRYCLKPASVQPYVWNDSIVDWPVSILSVWRESIFNLSIECHVCDWHVMIALLFDWSNKCHVCDWLVMIALLFDWSNDVMYVIGS